MRSLSIHGTAGALLSLGLLVGAGPALAVAPPAFGGLYVFGDSLSDNGNLFKLIGQPGFPYFEGRFSNGPVAAEYLATGLGLNSPTQFFNFAVGGAQTGTANGIGVRSQVGVFTGLLGPGSADPSALYMVWAGANDLLQAEFSTLADPVALTGLVSTATSNLSNAVQDLFDKGARNFLLPSLPNLGATPRLQALGPLAVAAGAQVAQTFNGALMGSYGALAGSLAGERFYYFDTYKSTNDAAAGFLAAGGNVSGTCAGAAAFPACSGYMFFDDIHPTTATHALLGQQMLAAVPEPQTMLMMAVGVAVLLGMGRRRLRAAA